MSRTAQFDTMCVCPMCKSDGIVERATLVASFPITYWDDDGTPLEYSLSPTWDSDEDYHVHTPPYMCEECHYRFNNPQIMTDKDYNEYWRTYDHHGEAE